MKKFISLLLVLMLVFGVVSSSFANVESSNYGNVFRRVDDEVFVSEDENMFEGNCCSNEYDNGTESVSATSSAVAATYFIPGLGKVVLLATGVILFKDEIVSVGSWLYNLIKTFIENFTDDKIVNVSNNKNWTDKGSEKKVLEEVNGKRGDSRPGSRRDGTIVTDVKDKETGKKIGEIHHKQPEYKYSPKARKDVATGKKYPDHYHDKANKLGKGGNHHWYWD